MLDPNLINVNDFLQSLRELIKKCLPSKSSISVDAIICIAPEKSEEIVMKLHEIINKQCYIDEDINCHKLSISDQELSNSKRSDSLPLNIKKNTKNYDEIFENQTSMDSKDYSTCSNESPITFTDSRKCQAFDNFTYEVNGEDLEYTNGIDSYGLFENKDLDEHVVDDSLVENTIDIRNCPTPISIIPDDDDVMIIKEESVEINDNSFSMANKNIVSENLQKINGRFSSFNCKICKWQSFNRFNDLYEHNHNMHLKFTCSHCQNLFTLSSNLRRHERLHTGIKKWSCYDCHKKFHRRSDMQIHMKKHTKNSDGNKFVKPLKQLNVFNNHVIDNNESSDLNLSSLELPTSSNNSRESHSNDIEYPNISSHFMKKENILEKHDSFTPNQVHDDSKRENFTQNADVKEIAEENMLFVKHEQISEDVSQFDSCANSFTNNDAGKEFVCMTCLTIFIRFEDLSDHNESIHHRFVCHICHETFSNRNNRLRHVHAHTRTKIFSCEFCNKNFSRSDSLKEHLITHSEGYANGKCDFCGWTNDKKAILFAHIKKCSSNRKRQVFDDEQMYNLSIN